MAEFNNLLDALNKAQENYEKLKSEFPENDFSTSTEKAEIEFEKSGIGKIEEDIEKLKKEMIADREERRLSEKSSTKREHIMILIAVLTLIATVIFGLTATISQYRQKSQSTPQQTEGFYVSSSDHF